MSIQDILQEALDFMTALDLTVGIGAIVVVGVVITFWRLMVNK